MTTTLDSQVDALQDMFGGEPEPLLPELEVCIDRDDTFPMLKCAPFVNTFYSGPMQNRMLNEMLKQKRHAYDTAVADLDFGMALALVERPWRVDVLNSLRIKMTDAEFAEQLASTWVDTEIVHQAASAWDAMWKRYALAPMPMFLMNAYEQRVFATIPDEIVLYRGASWGEGAEFPTGRSWTVSKKQAQWFADRNGKVKHVVFSRTFKRDDVLAYFNDRNEEEYVIRESAL